MSDNGSGDGTRQFGRYEAIVQSIADPLCTLGPDGRLVDVNEAFEARTGYDADTARGEDLTLVTSEETARRIDEMVTDQRAAATLSRDTVEADLQPRDGETVPVECAVTLLPAGADGPDGAVVVMRDLTRLKQREQRLSKLASVISHDLRNPMDVALGRAEVLPEVADVDDEAEQHLDAIHDALMRMEQLIQEVLTLSRQGGEVVESETVSLETVAREAWANVDTGAATLTVTADGELRAHRARLLRLLENLFRNAVEHGSTSPPSQARADAVEHAGPDVSVEVGALDMQWDTAETGFYVADDGPGVPSDDRDRIFEDGYSTSQSGTGLGLSIVTEIARAHGWSVEYAESDVGGVSDEQRESGPGESSPGARFEITGISIPSV